MEHLGGRVAVVTGAAGGIGLGIAQSFVGEGMRVVLADIDEDALSGAVGQLRGAGADVVGVGVDVTDPASVDALADETVHRFGAVHVIVNNAGLVRGGRSWELSLEEWELVVGVDLWGVVHGVRAFVPRILATGQEGHVVNVGSMASVSPRAGIAPYVASKHAVLGLSDSLRAELEEAGAPVGVSVVMPGTVRTRMVPVGIDPSVVGALVVGAMRTGLPYVFTHPDRMPEVEARFSAITACTPPPLPAGDDDPGPGPGR